jgi:DNA-binding FadR family transcriptional regulator
MQAIAARRPEAARAAMAKLLQESTDDVRRALAQDRVAAPSPA